MNVKGMLKKWQNLKIKQKLIFTLLLITIIPIITLQYFASRITSSKMEASSNRQAEYIKNSVSNILDGYKIKSSNYINFLRGEQNLVDAAFITSLTGDKTRVVTELKKHKSALDIDSLEVIDTGGKIIGRGHNIDNIEGLKDNKSDKNIIKEALAGKVTVDIEEEGGVYSINAAGPIIREDKPIAVIMSGIFLDNQFAKKLKAQSGTEVVIVFNNKITATTFPYENIKNINKEINSDAEHIKVDDIQYENTFFELRKADNTVVGKIYTLLNRRDIKDAISNMRLILIIITIVSLAIALSMGYVISRNIAIRLSKDVSFAQTVAHGNLQQQMTITTNDEIGILGKSLNKMAENLKTMINNIRGSAENISVAAVQINTNTDKLSKGAKAQAESTESSTASINQMNTSIKGVADSAEALSQVADNSSASILEMTASINQIAQSTDALSAAVETTSSAISEMSASIKQISDNVNVLSLASEETASAVNKIATTIKGVEDNVNESAKVSENVKKDASEIGIKAIEKTIDGMNRIKESVEATGVIINKLGERSQQIGKILTVIDDVTDQTNLLALNAAIIAAQSGEHGRGFAVVADEIKDMAERTSFSTKEISQMIESIQKEVGDAINAMKDSSKNVIEGMNLSRDASSALSKILNSADKSAQMSKDIEKATMEQAKELHQVNKSVQSITDMVRQIAYATQEQTKGSKQIVDSVEKMRDISRQVSQAVIEQTKGSKQINDAVESVTQKVHLIVRATKEQKIGSEQIVHSIEQIRDITLQNLDSFTEIKKTIDILVDQADILKAEVRKFVI